MKVNEILKVYKQYQKAYNDICYPVITEDNYVYVHDVDYWFQFMSEDLHNNIYKLYINMEAFTFSDDFIEALLFHEFTHLYDSIKFREYSNYKEIMLSYSEINASYVYMKKLTSHLNNLSAFDSIVIENSTISINEYYKKRSENIKLLVKSFPDNVESLMDTMLYLTYFIGEYLFLHEVGVCEDLKIISPYCDEINNMIKYYPIYPNRIVESYFNIIEKYKKNREKILACEFSNLTNGILSPEDFLKRIY